jgi:S-DNA-T family DNA segregation ATPase FtsK/SpoIIIE
LVSIRGMRKHHWFSEVAGVLLLLLAAITLLALVTYDGRDSTWFDSGTAGVRHNRVGWVGSLLSEALLQLLGVAAFMVPVVCVGVGWNRFRGKGAAASYGKLFGYTLLVGSLAGLLHLLYGTIAFGGERFGAGGNVVGAGVGGGLTALFGSAGATLVAVALLASSILVTTRFSFARTGRLLAGWAHGGLAALGARWKERREARSRDAERRAVQKKHARRAAEAAAKGAAKEVPAQPARAPRPSITLADDDEPSPPTPPRPRPEPRVVPTPARKEAAPSKQAPLPMDPGSAGVALPSLDLLNEVQPQEGEDEKELLERAQQLTDKFREFAVEGTVVAIHPGPVVTTFEYKPEAGVKYSKITGLVDDLCLGLKAESVRIDRIPGRSTVGIEVPNRHQETIFPRELLGSEKFRGGRSPLTLALGKDISGEVFTSELDRMPHLLIAGATGAGKSVGLNGMITSVLYKATPQDVRFIMIDTKMIELGIYADIPHLLVPVVTDPKAASTALKWAVREMEQRYRKLASVGVRNLDQFNALLASEPGRTMVDERTAEEVPLHHLPRIVIVIDEMADLMMVSSADVEESVMRLAQMARAVGIHLILATQRPSVDVITGTIKANFPARIAFRVSQRVDSRTIIDQQGAEHLLGRGDMLFLPPGSARLVRIHGGYITEAELNRVVAFLKKQAKPVYDESVLKEPEEERGAFDEGERDAMFVDAVRCILQEGQCSITLVQRRLRLGYARAARIVDRMEQEGIVGPADGSKPREVLVGPEVLESLV